MARAGIPIGKLSARTGVSADAIRFYEKQGLIEAPPRSEGGFRLFQARDAERIAFIQRAQRLGFSLREIGELLVLGREDGEACTHMRGLLREKLATIRGKKRELEVLENQLAKSLRKCQRQLKAAGESHKGRCPVIEEIVRGGSDES